MSSSPKGDRLSPEGFWEITPQTVQGQLDQYRIIDVREPSEFNGPLGHIEGADLVPLGTVADECEDWDKEKPLLLICKMGGRSHRACTYLKDEGFTSLTNLLGGMTGWNRAGFPVTKDQE